MIPSKAPKESFLPKKVTINSALFLPLPSSLLFSIVTFHTANHQFFDYILRKFNRLWSGIRENCSLEIPSLNYQFFQPRAIISGEQIIWRFNDPSLLTNTLTSSNDCRLIENKIYEKKFFPGFNVDSWRFLHERFFSCCVQLWNEKLFQIFYIQIWNV